MPQLSNKSAIGEISLELLSGVAVFGALSGSADDVFPQRFNLIGTH